MKKPENTEKWGRNTATKRYASGGTIKEKQWGPDLIGGGGGGGLTGGRGPGSPAGPIQYDVPIRKIPPGVSGLSKADSAKWEAAKRVRSSGPKKVEAGSIEAPTRQGSGRGKSGKGGSGPLLQEEYEGGGGNRSRGGRARRK